MDLIFKVGDIVCFNEKATLVNDARRWIPFKIIEVTAHHIRYEEVGKETNRNMVYADRFHILSLYKNKSFKHLLHK